LQKLPIDPDSLNNLMTTFWPTDSPVGGGTGGAPVCVNILLVDLPPVEAGCAGRPPGEPAALAAPAGPRLDPRAGRVGGRAGDRQPGARGGRRPRASLFACGPGAVTNCTLWLLAPVRRELALKDAGVGAVAGLLLTATVDGMARLSIECHAGGMDGRSLYTHCMPSPLPSLQPCTVYRCTVGVTRSASSVNLS
jgi:hypothetical protein